MLNREETLATISTTFAHMMMIVSFKLIDIERIIGMVGARSAPAIAAEVRHLRSIRFKDTTLVAVRVDFL